MKTLIDIHQIVWNYARYVALPEFIAIILTNFVAPFTYHFNRIFDTSPTVSAFLAALPSWLSLLNNPSPQQLWDQIWYSSNHPYLPFILKSPFHSDLLCSLSVPLEQIKVVYVTHSWHLTWQCAKDWKTLKIPLDLDTKSLLSFFQQTHPNIQLSFWKADLLSKYGYFNTYGSESVMDG